MTRPLRRTAVALAAACAVLFAMASPASAATLNVTITGGLIDIQPTDAQFDLGENDNPCDAPSVLTVETTTTPRTVTVSDLFVQTTAIINGMPYVVEIFDVFGLPGEYNVAGDEIGLNGDDPIYLVLGAAIWPLVPETDCDKVDPEDPICEVAVEMNFSGDYAADLNTPVDNDTFDLDGVSLTGGIQPNLECDGGASVIVNDSVTVTGLTGVVDV